MKILVLLSASVIGFGLVFQETTSVDKPSVKVARVVEAEAPAAHILLDTVVITAASPITGAIGQK